MALSLITDEFVVLRPTYWCVGLVGMSFGDEPDRDDRTVLAALIDHPRFRDHYSSPDSTTSEPIHGPYDLTLLDAAHFRPLGEGEAEAEFQALLDDAAQYGATPETLDQARRMADIALGAGGRAYSLSKRDDLPWHSWGWLLGGEWHEVACVDRVNARVFDLLWFVD